MMKREKYKMHLSEAVKIAFMTGRSYVKQDLRIRIVFDVYPNQSFDGNPLVDDEQLFPDDSQRNNEPIRMQNEEEVVKYLWRDEKVPEWIDISLASATDEYTCLSLLCCGRFTATDKLLYHQRPGIPPFSVKSPWLPPDYDFDKPVETQKFDVNWRQ